MKKQQQMSACKLESIGSQLIMPQIFLNIVTKMNAKLSISGDEHPNDDHMLLPPFKGWSWDKQGSRKKKGKRKMCPTNVGAVLSLIGELQPIPKNGCRWQHSFSYPSPSTKGLFHAHIMKLESKQWQKRRGLVICWDNAFVDRLSLNQYLKKGRWQRHPFFMLQSIEQKPSSSTHKDSINKF